jgi:signal peptidase I
MKQTDSATPANETKLPGPPKSVIREYFESAVVTIIMALFGMTFVIQAVKVPTGSMQNTIEIGDHLLVNKFVFGAGGPSLPFLPQREIKRGDIIVFKYPGNQHDRNHPRDKDSDNIPLKTNYVKRVIGLPGETIEFRGATVTINGKPLPEQVMTANQPKENAPLAVVAESPAQPGATYKTYYSSDTITDARAGQLSRTDQGIKFGFPEPYKIPDDSYFVMGDSRDHSLDSRFWGVVKRDYIFGRAMFIYWSFDETREEGNFLHTRWGRTGKMIK